MLTIEPIIAAGTGWVQNAGDGWTMRTSDGSTSAHFEHTMVITKGDPIILTVDEDSGPEAAWASLARTQGSEPRGAHFSA